VWGNSDPEHLSATIEAYAGFTGALLSTYTMLGPYLLFCVGGLLMIGLFTRGSAFIAVIIFLPLVIAAGAVVVIENPLALIPENRTLYKDIVVLVGFLSVALSGPGALSLDNVMRAIYQEK
jgi:uncharacterized membrane protein YphA (DoxX/SURF4 family)